MTFSEACVDGPLTLACLEFLGISGPSVSKIALMAFGFVIGFWSMGFVFGSLASAIRRA